MDKELTGPEEEINNWIDRNGSSATLNDVVKQFGKALMVGRPGGNGYADKYFQKNKNNLSAIMKKLIMLPFMNLESRQ